MYIPIEMAIYILPYSSYHHINVVQYCGAWVDEAVVSQEDNLNR